VLRIKTKSWSKPCNLNVWQWISFYADIRVTVQPNSERCDCEHLVRMNSETAIYTKPFIIYTTSISTTTLLGRILASSSQPYGLTVEF
jgi:hypothetical protein